MKQDRYHGAMTTGAFFCITRAYQAKLPPGGICVSFTHFPLGRRACFFLFLGDFWGDLECFLDKISVKRRFCLCFLAVRGANIAKSLDKIKKIWYDIVNNYLKSISVSMCEDQGHEKSTTWTDQGSCAHIHIRAKGALYIVS